MAENETILTWWRPTVLAFRDLDIRTTNPDSNSFH
jgi:hypothetical protein